MEETKDAADDEGESENDEEVFSLVDDGDA